MKINASPFLGLLLWTMSSLIALSEGVASFNKVTTKNISALTHHKLTLAFRITNGLTHVALKVDADKDHRLEGGVYITIHSMVGVAKPPIVVFDFNPDGVSKSFAVANDQMANVSIAYRLRDIKDLRCDLFDIDAGELPRLAAGIQLAEQAAPSDGAKPPK
jgi:hypothetical protein